MTISTNLTGLPSLSCPAHDANAVDFLSWHETSPTSARLQKIGLGEKSALSVMLGKAFLCATWSSGQRSIVKVSRITRTISSSVGSPDQPWMARLKGSLSPALERHVRKLLRDARVRVAGTAPVRLAGRGPNGRLPLHRGLV